MASTIPEEMRNLMEDLLYKVDYSHTTINKANPKKNQAPIPPIPIPPLDPVSSAAGGAAALLAREAWSWTRQTAEQIRKRRNEQYEDINDKLLRLDGKLMRSEGNLELVWDSLTDQQQNRIHDTIASGLKDLDNKIKELNFLSRELSRRIYYRVNDGDVLQVFPNEILHPKYDDPHIVISYEVGKPSSALSCKKWLFYFGPLLLDANDPTEFCSRIETYADRYNLSEFLAHADWDMRCYNQDWCEYLYTNDRRPEGVWKVLRKNESDFNQRKNLCNDIKHKCTSIDKDINVRNRTLPGEYYQRTRLYVKNRGR